MEDLIKDLGETVERIESKFSQFSQMVEKIIEEIKEENGIKTNTNK